MYFEQKLFKLFPIDLGESYTSHQYIPTEIEGIIIAI